MGILTKPPLTVAIGGQSIGHPPIGPTSPGYEPIYNLIMGARINMKAEPWTIEMLYHRPIGHMPNYAPKGVQFRGSRLPVIAARKGNAPVPGVAPNFGNLWAGVGG